MARLTEEADACELNKRIHPDLRGGQSAFPHRFNQCQMETLAAICDTFIPSLPIESLDLKAKELQKFFKTSASDAGTPTQVAGLIFRCLDAQLQGLVFTILWLLSTRIGTLLLCGWSGVCGKFPYVHRFTKLPIENRERALSRWSEASIPQFQSLFKLFKCYCMYAFFSKADKAGRNDAVWDAIGYPAPDPTWNGLNEEEREQEADDLPPLGNVFDMQSSTDDLVKFLSTAGFSVQAPDLDEAEAAKVIIDCDVVVVGSGAGGGVCAGVLAQKGYKVLVLEKGKYYAGNQLSLLEGPSMQALYEGHGLLTTRDGGVNILAGSTLGGGTAVNWSASFKTPESVIEEWSTVHGLKRFASQEYAAAMDKICERLGVGSHGDEEEFESFQNAVLRKGCKKLGLRVETIPRNCRKKKHRCGHCAFGCKTRQKQGTHETWLRDAAEAGAVILCGCTADKVILQPQTDRFKTTTATKKWRAEGVEASSADGRRLLIRAKSTVVSCGALHTPILLRKSGLTNAQIGSNLHIHPTQVAWGYFPSREDLPEGAIFDGPIMTAISKVDGGASVLEVPAFHPASYAVMTPWRSGSSFKHDMLKYSRMSHVIVIPRDGSSGSVSYNRNGRQDLPVLSYSLSGDDEETLRKGTELALRVLVAAGAEEVGIQHPDGEKFNVLENDERQFEGFIGKVRKKGVRSVAMATASAHQMGSCRMGVDSKVSAVDEEGETWESSGLFVADSSLFPTALGVNPMITVQSLAFCVAHSVDSYCQQRVSIL